MTILYAVKAYNGETFAIPVLSQFTAKYTAQA